MSKQQPEKLGDIIEAAGRSFGWEDGLNRERAKEALLAQIEPDARGFVKVEAGSGGLYYIKTSSAAVKNNLVLCTEQIKNKANAALASKLVIALKVV